MRAIALTLLLHAASACGASPQAVPSAPPGSSVPPAAVRPLAPSPAAPPAETSTITIPIRATLATLLPTVESQVPKNFRDTIRERGVTVDYAVARGPITLKMIGTGLHATSLVRYQLQACPARLPCVSCGIGEPMRQTEIFLQSHLVWDSTWRLRSTTTAQPPRFRNRCTITALNLDITDRYIAPIIAQQLREAAQSIDHNMPALTNIKPTAQQIWNALQQPSEIAPRTWLVFEPLDIALGTIRGENLLVNSTLTIRARTRVVIGEKPAATPRPLPPLRAEDVAGAIRVPFEITLPYSEASRLATEQFGNRLHRTSAGDVRIGTIALRPAAGGRIGVEALIDYRGGRLKHYSGPVSLEGTPAYDAATQSVTIPDLDYTLDQRSRNLFVRVAESVAHDAVREQLRQSARFALADQLRLARIEIARSLTRQLSTGASMTGRIDLVQPMTVSVAPEALHVRVLVTGSAEVNVTKFN